MKIEKSLSFIAEGPSSLSHGRPQMVEYPMEALGPFRMAVEAAHDLTQAPLAIAAQSALSVASLAVQSFADVETLGGYAPVSLYCLTIAKSGERKSATDKKFIRGLTEFERGQEAVFRAEHAAWRDMLAVWKGQRETILNSVKRGKISASKAASDLQALGAEPAPPLSPILTTTDPTIEGLHKLFMAGQPSLGVFSDEGGQFFGGFGMNKENRLKTIAGLSALWGGDPINRTRSGDGSITLHGRRLALHLMLQPIVALPLFSERLVVDQGFLARFLICEPQSAIGTRFKREPEQASDLVLNEYADRLKAILAMKEPTNQDHLRDLIPRKLRLASDAKAILWEFYEFVERAQTPNGQYAELSAFASKSPEQAARIAGVMTLWSDVAAEEVSAVTMQNAVKLAHFYLLEAARVTSSEIVATQVANAEKLLSWLKTTWPQRARINGRDPTIVLPRDIQNVGPNAFRSQAKLDRALEVLLEYGWLSQLPPGTEVGGSARKRAYQIAETANGL